MMPTGEPGGGAAVDYGRLAILSRAGWIWQVHANQSYLGRMIFRLARDGEEGSLAACTEAEWLALRATMRRFEEIWEVIFQPDRYEYGQLGNEYAPLHVHAVPRYLRPRIWGGTTFRDARWESDWAPTPPTPLTLAQTYAFAEWLGARMLDIDERLRAGA